MTEVQTIPLREQDEIAFALNLLARKYAKRQLKDLTKEAKKRVLTRFTGRRGVL